MNFLTVQEASKKSGITESVLYYEMEVGRLPYSELVGRKVIKETDLQELQKRIKQKELLLSPKEYCKKYKMSRSKFNYWKLSGKIDVVKIDGRIFVREG